jgi:hypothetical protein
MSWIESHQSLSRHRKTMRVVSVLKVDRHKLLGHLHELWWWGLDNADTDGNLEGIAEEQIAMGAEWPVKDATRFVAALVDGGFLEGSPGAYILHDWYAYAGKLNTKRAANRERMKRARAEHVQRTTDARAAHVHTLPNQPNQPNQPVPTVLGGVGGTEDDGGRYRRLCDAWLSATGSTLSPQPAERFEAFAEDLSEGWVVDAIRITGEQGNRAPKYAFSILDRWKTQGRDSSKTSTDPTADKLARELAFIENPNIEGIPTSGAGASR